jgi:hypothetical protein
MCEDLHSFVLASTSLLVLSFLYRWTRPTPSRCPPVEDMHGLLSCLSEKLKECYHGGGNGDLRNQKFIFYSLLFLAVHFPFLFME